LKGGNQYIIPFKGLKEGIHSFNFKIGKEFFEENLALEIPDGLLTAEVVLDKKVGLLVLDVKLKGYVELVCDRCLEYFNYQLNYKGQLFIKFKEDIEEPDENVIFLHPKEDLIDLNQYFFDCIGLNIPIQKFHPEDDNGELTCNKEMLKILDNYYFNKKHSNNENIDPRWSKLKDFLNEGNKKQ